MEKLKIYAKSILIPVIVGGIVGLLISGSMDYNSLQKPFLSPPSLVFLIVWTILYILMTVKFYKKDKIAGLLQVPYVIWTIFATYLNFGIYLLNK